MDFPGSFNPGRNELTDDPRLSRPWLRDVHHPMLGRHLPRILWPEWPDVRVEPSFVRDRVAPTGFKAYTRRDDVYWADYGLTYEEARWNLEQRVAGSV